jgi:large subunit ribosomal protein L31e
MAEKKTAEKKDDKKLDRTYIIPIRRLSLTVSRWRKAKKAVSVIRKFMKRHMKSDDIKIGQELNELIWERGGKTVPAKVEVHAVREKGITVLNLVGAPLPPIEKKEKKEEAKEEKKEEHKKEEHKKAEEPKAEPKKEEHKKEEPKATEHKAPEHKKAEEPKSPEHAHGHEHKSEESKVSEYSIE